MSKYNNRKIVVDSIKFDSLKEARRYRELKLLERAGKINSLFLQVPFELFPKSKGKRAVKYIADFVYWENDMKIVEDCKGYKTDVYKLKKRMMFELHGIEIKET